MAKALFVVGHAASGKTTLAKKWILTRMKKGDFWCLMDKDDSGEILAPELMKAMGFSAFDRDSKDYKDNVRDLEYMACIHMANQQLNLGINVVLPGPWTKELKSGDIFFPENMGLPKGTEIGVVYLDVPKEVLHQRIIKRANPRDSWKLNNWELFQQTLNVPNIVKEKKLLLLNNSHLTTELEKMIENEIKSVNYDTIE